MAQVGNEQLKSEDWFLDSDYSNHMCNKKEYFTNYNVKLGNNAILVVKGKGNMWAHINN